VPILLPGPLGSYRDLVLSVDWGYSYFADLGLTLTVTECLVLTGAFDGLM
jgi:hypothetical protein